MADTDNILLSLVSGLVGTGIGVFFTIRHQNKVMKRSLVLELYKEWNSTEMTMHRRVGYGLVKKYPNDTYVQLVKRDENGSISYFVVMRFFLRIHALISHRQVSEAMVYSMFGDYFYQWYYQSYEFAIAPVDSETARQMKELARQFREIVSFTDHDGWVKKYRVKRKESLKAVMSIDSINPEIEN